MMGAKHVSLVHRRTERCVKRKGSDERGIIWSTISRQRHVNNEMLHARLERWKRQRGPSASSRGARPQSGKLIRRGWWSRWPITRRKTITRCGGIRWLMKRMPAHCAGGERFISLPTIHTFLLVKKAPANQSNSLFFAAERSPPGRPVRLEQQHARCL